jgi:hypothetical protein
MALKVLAKIPNLSRLQLAKSKHSKYFVIISFVKYMVHYPTLHVLNITVHKDDKSNVTLESVEELFKERKEVCIMVTIVESFRRHHRRKLLHSQQQENAILSK